MSIDTVHKLQVARLAAFTMTLGTSPPSVLLNVWCNYSIAHEGHRLVLTSFGVLLVNSIGVLSSNILNQATRKYISALATTAFFGRVGFYITLALVFWMARDNRCRNRKVEVRDIPTAF